MSQDQPASPPGGALPLSEAMRCFVLDDLWRKYERAREAYEKLPRRPNSGFLSVPIREWKADRANRRAREQQAYSAKADVEKAWQNIERAFFEQLISGNLAAYAQKEPPFGTWQQIPAAACRNLHLKDVRRGRIVGPNIELINLHILEVRNDGAPVPTTGAPGRPSDMHLVLAEFERRLEARKIEASLAEQSRVLLGWFKLNHPDKQPPGRKTIENNLRDRYREATRG